MLVSCSNYQGSMAEPLNCTSLWEHLIFLLARFLPISGSDSFSAQATIIAAKTWGLDPKCAKSFNPTTIKDHFQLLGKVFEGLWLRWSAQWFCNATSIFLPKGVLAASVGWGVLFSNYIFFLFLGWSVSVSPALAGLMPWFANISSKHIYFLCHSSLYDGWWAYPAVTHEMPEQMDLAFKHCILLYCLHSKMTHKLQLLGLGVFNPLQSAWHKHCQDSTINHKVITQNTVVQDYMSDTWSPSHWGFFLKLRHLALLSWHLYPDWSCGKHEHQIWQHLRLMKRLMRKKRDSLNEGALSNASLCDTPGNPAPHQLL